MIQKSTISLAVLALISNQSSAVNLNKQRGFVNADDFSEAGEGGNIPQVTDEDKLSNAAQAKLDDAASADNMIKNANIMAITNQVKAQQMTDALNMARDQAQQDRKSHMNQFTGLIDNADGTHQFPEGGQVKGANTYAQVQTKTQKRLEELRFDKMTADDLKAAYETAQAVQADKAQEAELFKRAHDARVKRDQLAKLAPEEQSQAPFEGQVEKKNSLTEKKRHHRKHHKKHHDETDTQSLAQGQYINDHYDGKHSYKLENGAEKFYSDGMTQDHYDSVKEVKKAGTKKVETKKEAAPKGGVPPELQKTAAAKGSKAQVGSSGVPAEIVSIVQKDNKWPNDHYDGKKNDGLDNGKKVHESKEADHYDSKKADAVKTAAQVANTTNNTNSTAISTAQVGQKATFINDHYDGKHSDGLENGAKKFDYSEFTVDHYDDKGAKHKDVPVAKKAQTEEKKAAGPPPELAGKQPAASIAQVGYVNDLYDGQASFKLENGAKKINYDGYSPDHYDSVKEKKTAGAKKEGKKDAKKAAKKVETKKEQAPKGGVPPELMGTAATPKQSKVQTEKNPTEDLQEDSKDEGSAQETLSVAQTSKNKEFVNDHYDGKKNDGLENGAKHQESKEADHYDSKKADAAPAAATKAAGPAELAGTQAAAQVENKAKFINDHYDGKHSDGLENGAKKHDYSGYTVDHYDDKGAKHKDAPKAAVKAQGEAAPAEKPKAAGPPELAGSLAEVSHKKKHHHKKHHKKHNKEYAQADEQINE